MSTDVTFALSPENPDLVRFSASQTKKYLHCPAAWWYSRHAPRTSNGPAAFGNEVHARLERWQLGAPDAPDDVAVCDKAEAAPFLQDADVLRRAAIVAKAVREAFPGPAPNVKPEREFFMTVTVGKVQFQLNGFVDTEIAHPDSVHVMDLKTTGNFGRALSSDELAADPQALIYAAAGFAGHEAAKTVHCEWVYAHSKNKRKILGPRPSATFTRATVELGFRALFDSAWAPMLKASARKTAPKGDAPNACTRYRWGCDFDALNGGPCNQHARVPVSQTLLSLVED